jgi:hypothetical protein
MYLPSDTPILADQRASAARNGACSDARIAAMRRTSACGRARLFNTIVSPLGVLDQIGMGTAIDTAKLQAQTDDSRASGILGTGGWPQDLETAGQQSVAEVIANAPEVVSLNRGGGCSTPSYTPVPLGADPVPGMPQRAPNIVQGLNGPMYYRGAPSTIQGDYPPVTAAVNPYRASQPPTLAVKQYYEILNTRGLTGYAPPWSDAGVLANADDAGSPGIGSWLMDHPLLALLLAGGGVYALSRRKR